MRRNKTVSKTEYIAKLRAIYQQADRVWQHNKQYDRETMVQTLLLLERSPAERLAQALLRLK